MRFPPFILMTRPVDDARDFGRDVRALGWIPLVAPMLRIVPLRPPCPDMNSAQAIVFTSANAVRHAPDVPRHLPVYCVGDRTADMARTAGFADVHSAAGDIGDLERVLGAAGLMPGGCVLHVCGADIVRPMVLPGVRVVPCVAYRADPVDRLPLHVRWMIRFGGIDAVTFFSARTGQAFVDTMKKTGMERHCAGMRALCLSDSVVQSVSALPWRAVDTAPRPDRAAMLDLIRGF